MSRRNQDFDMYQGEDKIVFIKLDNADGTPFDSVGATMQWWLARTNHSDKTVDKTIGAGLTVVAGGVNITLASADTIDLRPELYYHELQVTKGGVLSVTTIGCCHLRPSLDMRGWVSGVGASSAVGSAVAQSP